jgi:hypothetical protein
MRRYLVIIVALILAFCACKKQDNTKHVNVNADLKAAFNFLPGTYWIYRDSISGQIDSFFVRSNQDTYYLVSGQSFEDIRINISEYKIGSPISYSDTLFWIFDYQYNEFSVYCDEHKIYNGEIEYIPLINYPFQTTLSNYPLFADYYNTLQGSVIGIYNTYEVASQTFTNVAEVNQLDSLGPIAPFSKYTYNDLIYICSGVGLIKMNLNHPQDSLHRIWELQRWKIVK